MKITVGLGSIDDYPEYVKAGADEVFCGYIPADWAVSESLHTPINRREVVCYNVQIGSESELKILAKMVERFRVPVSITLNSLYYQPEHYPVLLELMCHLKGLGFDRFIIADPALIVYLYQAGVMGQFKIAISGELGSDNHLMAQLFMEMGAERLIFHRKNTLSQMEQMIESIGNKDCEYEAFILNEMCHFHGGFCNTLHCDELAHMCLVPYKLGAFEGVGADNEIEEKNYRGVVGEGGCGLCSLWKLKKMGMHFLKLVSRGNYYEDTIRDIRALKEAIKILETSPDEKSYIEKMKQVLFDGGCSGNCYYR